MLLSTAVYVIWAEAFATLATCLAVKDPMEAVSRHSGFAFAIGLQPDYLLLQRLTQWAADILPSFIRNLSFMNRYYAAVDSVSCL